MLCVASAHLVRHLLVKLLLLPRLRALHTRLLFLLRAWPVAVSALHDNASFSHRAGHRLTSETPMSVWLLGQVPPSLNANFWYDHSASLQRLRRIFDVIYSTAGAWHNVAGLRPIGAPFALAALCYYVLNAEAAAESNTALLSAADTRVVSAVWTMLDSNVARFISGVVRPIPLGFMHDLHQLHY
jgi:hypothetical protein